MFGGLQIKAQIGRHNDMVCGRRLQHDAMRQSKSVESGMPRRANALDVDLLGFRQQIAKYTLDVSPNRFCDGDTQVEDRGKDRSPVSSTDPTVCTLRYDPVTPSQLQAKSVDWYPERQPYRASAVRWFFTDIAWPISV